MGLNKKHSEIAKVLVEEIKYGQVINIEKTITYGKLGVRVGLNTLTQKDRDVFGEYLGALSRYCHHNRMPLISAIVIRKSNEI